VGDRAGLKKRVPDLTRSQQREYKGREHHDHKSRANGERGPGGSKEARQDIPKKRTSQKNTVEAEYWRVTAPGREAKTAAGKRGRFVPLR